MVQWSCKGQHCRFMSDLYGTILWNNKTWVWTHPRCPFIIRYDWYESKGVFKQVFKKKIAIWKHKLTDSALARHKGSYIRWSCTLRLANNGRWNASRNCGQPRPSA